MQGGESFSFQVRDTVTDLVMTGRDKAALLKIQGVENRKVGVAAVTVMGKIWGI